MKLIRIFSLLMLSGSMVADCQALLAGHAPQFANDSILVRQITNPISGHSTVIDTLRVKADGTFRETIPICQSGWIFMNTGLFRITMYLDEGFGYEITLPPKTEKSEADIRNPFFKPVIVHIKVQREYSLKNSENFRIGSDLNSRIFRFDTLLSAKNRKILEARRMNRNYNSDSLIQEIEMQYQHDTSDYFKDYRRYRYGIMKINSRDVGLQYLYEQFLGSDSPDNANPAYYELFSNMYDEFLFYYSQTENGRGINDLVNRTQDLEALKDSLMNHPAVPNAELAELIILKEIFDIYHKDYYYREALLIILDSITRAPESEIHAKWAKEIKEYLIKLKIGQKPPDFHLVDREDEIRTLEDYNGKYVYLSFCTPDNYSCLKEFPFMEAIYKVHHEYLEIITVMVTEKRETMIAFMDRNEYDWTALFYGNNEDLLEDYNVRAFPTSYLIDPEGTLIQSPAALATEGLEEQLFRIMRSRGDL